MISQRRHILQIDRLRQDHGSLIGVDRKLNVIRIAVHFAASIRGFVVIDDRDWLGSPT